MPCTFDVDVSGAFGESVQRQLDPSVGDQHARWRGRTGRRAQCQDSAQVLMTSLLVQCTVYFGAWVQNTQVYAFLMRCYIIIAASYLSPGILLCFFVTILSSCIYAQLSRH